MTVTQLVTHSGAFHADELLSSVILTRLFPEAAVIRTRDRDLTTPAEGRVIYDVGRDHDADRMIFDHHQPDAPLREDGQPLSSFGLVWRHFGMDYLAALDIPEDHRADVFRSFDQGFVLPIDLVDNGVLATSTAGPMLSDLTLPALLESLKPVFDDQSPDADDRAFHAALQIARAFVEARIHRKASKLRAESMVMAAIEAAGEGRVLELPMGMPFRSAVLKAGADHLLFVATPRSDGWTLTGIRLAEDGFDLRADLPAAWAGLTDEALEEASGVKGAKFCHNGRFIAVAETREAIMQLADLAVAEAEAAMV
ncbi:MYG1 family protein [Paracoccus indicus]|uniref:MYG1 family protein n=1 Tax=Paracoccus indicus TaxID=2079229 RepID=UPI000D3364A4|nr:MYG1 family protein [Paracoccus indicus]